MNFTQLQFCAGVSLYEAQLECVQQGNQAKTKRNRHRTAAERSAMLFTHHGQLPYPPYESSFACQTPKHSKTGCHCNKLCVIQEKLSRLSPSLIIYAEQCRLQWASHSGLIAPSDKKHGEEGGPARQAHVSHD